MPLLKEAEREFPGVSLPKPANVVRNVNRAKTKKLPKNPEENSLDFELEESGIEPGFLQDDISIGNPTRVRILILSTLSLLSLLHSAEFWAMDGTYTIVRKPFQVLFTIHVCLTKETCTK